MVLYIFAGAQLMQGAYVVSLARHRVRIETLAAPASSEIDLKQAAVHRLRVSSKAGYMSYIESMRGKVTQTGEKMPDRNFF